MIGKRFSAKKSAAVEAGQAALADLACSLGVDEELALLLADEALDLIGAVYDEGARRRPLVPSDGA
jgi:hypothetical protein